MRRPGPRHVSAALGAFTRSAAPGTVLARTQAVWREAAGEAVAAVADPVAERGGKLTVRCESAIWSHELELLGPDILGRLNGLLDPSGEGPLRALRVELGTPRGAAGEGL